MKGSRSFRIRAGRGAGSPLHGVPWHGDLDSPRKMVARTHPSGHAVVGENLARKGYDGAVAHHGHVRHYREDAVPRPDIFGATRLGSPGNLSHSRSRRL